MSPNEMKALIRRELEETWEAGKTHVIHETSHAHRVRHLPGDEHNRGTDSIKARRDAVRGAFSDMHVTIDHLIVEGDMAAARLHLSGKHTGEFMGIPPTGKHVTLTMHDLFRFEGDKIAEMWVELDRLAFFEQLGVMPPMRARE
jgi:predicted ester cyclase